MRRRILGKSGSSAPSGAVDKLRAVAGDICISNGTDIWFTPLTNWQAYTGTEYQAIGVVVVAVGDCGDDLVRVCSIPFMNCKTPDVGSMKSWGMTWNGYEYTIGGITQTTSSWTARADYNGKNSTVAILARATSQPNWRTDMDIYNSQSTTANGYFPAACCCWRFHTIGTNQGDWYLPAAGELYKSYMNKTSVGASLQALGMTIAYTYTGTSHWSSTVYSKNTTWQVRWYNGDIKSVTRYDSGAVRAFISF